MKQTQKDPFDYFKDKKINDTVTVKVLSSDNKGLTVQPEGCDIKFTLLKNHKLLFHLLMLGHLGLLEVKELMLQFQN